MLLRNANTSASRFFVVIWNLINCSRKKMFLHTKNERHILMHDKSFKMTWTTCYNPRNTINRGDQNNGNFFASVFYVCTKNQVLNQVLNQKVQWNCYSFKYPNPVKLLPRTKSFITTRFNYDIDGNSVWFNKKWLKSFTLRMLIIAFILSGVFISEIDKRNPNCWIFPITINWTISYEGVKTRKSLNLNGVIRSSFCINSIASQWTIISCFQEFFARCSS